jgi:hypothetical protein
VGIRCIEDELIDWIRRWLIRARGEVQAISAVQTNLVAHRIALIVAQGCGLSQLDFDSHISGKYTQISHYDKHKSFFPGKCPNPLSQLTQWG